MAVIDKYADAQIVTIMVDEARKVVSDEHIVITAESYYDIAKMCSVVAFKAVAGPIAHVYSCLVADMDKGDYTHHVAMGKAAGYAIRSKVHGDEIAMIVDLLVTGTESGTIEKHKASDGEVWLLTWKG